VPYFDDVVLTLTPEAPGTPGDFSCDALGALLEPDVTEETRKYLCGPKSLVSTPEWKLTLDYDQNWDASTGLSAWLQAHHGELATALIESSTLAQSATVTVRVKPGPFGGTAGEIAEGTVELSVDGQPTFAPYTPVAARETEDETEVEDEAVA